MKSGLGFLASATLLLLGVAPAVSAEVLFDATVDATCTLNVTRNGIMKVSTDLQTLSSTAAGGQSGQVGLSTTGGVHIALGTVTTVAKPPLDTATTTWSPTYTVAGTHTVAAPTAGQSTLAAPGNSTISVNLVGTKGSTDRFAAGIYQQSVTVLCEP